jgi:hypothetical protein
MKMMNGMMIVAALLSLSARAQDAAPPAPEAPAPAAAAAPAEAPSAEANCTDGLDDDGDAVTDCADSDCKPNAACKPDGKPEADDARCSDWIDNDEDGQTDCDDAECGRLPVCAGSWQGDLEGDGGAASGGAPETDGSAPKSRTAPETEGADSNDGVGFVGVRFGVVAVALQEMSVNNTKSPNTFDTVLDTRVETLQLRAFGALPLLEDSFFLINMRGERSPRLTFAMFQFPLFQSGHYLNLNTGGGSLSNQLIISVAKRPLIEPANYMLSAFEQGNGASAELHGPIARGLLRYRVFAGGGAGFSTGNIGGRRFAFDNFNYTYTLGGQLQFTPFGYYNRFESPYLYKPVPMQLALNLGAKWDQRQQERYPALNGQLIFRWGYFEAYLEDYAKAELNFGAIQNAYNIMLGVLVIPEWLFLAADFGQFWTSEFGVVEDVTGGGINVEDPPEVLQTELRRQRGETMIRAAAHLFFWRNNGILSARYALRLLDPPVVGPERDELFIDHQAWLAVQFRF